MTCNHVVRLRAAGTRYLDSNIVMMGVKFYCDLCGHAFRAVGVPEGVNPTAPGATDEGEVTVFPLVPMGEEPETVGVGRC